jgi:glutamate N-acetyltransferase/amino-acid N-acetyltransferase
MSNRPAASDIPHGFSFAATACGLKKSGLDLAFLGSETPAAAAALFTTNHVQAAPVLVSKAHLRQSRHRMRGVIVNSGNANCCTGARGTAATAATALATARELGCAPSQLLVCSTGVIGVPLRVEKILRAVPRLIHARRAGAGAFARLARAIMTTDTRPKWAAARFRIGGKQVRLLGCAKGAGMIHPRLATMLAFVVTDAAIAPALLARALRDAVRHTFNAITVDEDTSTNDTLALLANGASGAAQITAGSAHFGRFRASLEEVCRRLALEIVADGEGAQRVVEIEVRGAPSDGAADQVARTIANSPLVKTAFAGADPNWGRILAAAGRAGVPFDPARVEIRLAGITVCRRGAAVAFDERAAHRRLLAKYVSVRVDLGFRPGRRPASRSHEASRRGRPGSPDRGQARVWTCDFTGDYVRINASYRS